MVFLVLSLVALAVFVTFSVEFASRIFSQKRILFKKINNVIYYIVVVLSFALTLCFAYLYNLPASENDLIVLKIPAFLILAFCLINAPMFINSYGEDYWKQGPDTRTSKIKRLILEVILLLVIGLCGCFMCEVDVLWEIILVIALVSLLLLYRIIRYAVWFVKNK